MIEVAGIPKFESQLEVDRGELVKVKADQTKPNIDAASLAAGRAAFRARYEEAQRQAKMRERAAQRLAAERKQQEQEQKQVRQAKRDRGGPDLGR